MRTTGTPGHSTRRGAAAVLLVAAVFLVGCETTRPARLPTAAELAAAADRVMPIHEGDRVRVTLSDGTSVSGVVSGLTPDEFTVGRAGNYGREERTIRKDEIVDLQVVGSTKTAEYLGSAVGVASILVLALLVLVGTGLTMD